MGHGDKKILQAYKSLATARLLDLATQLARNGIRSQQLFESGDFSGAVNYAREGIRLSKAFMTAQQGIVGKDLSQDVSRALRAYQKLFSVARKNLRNPNLQRDGVRISLHAPNIGLGNNANDILLSSLPQRIEEIDDHVQRTQKITKHNARVFSETNNQIKKLIAGIGRMTPTEIRRQVGSIQKTYLEAIGLDKYPKYNRIKNLLTEVRRYANNPDPSTLGDIRKSLVYVGNFLTTFDQRIFH